MPSIIAGVNNRIQRKFETPRDQTATITSPWLRNYKWNKNKWKFEAYTRKIHLQLQRMKKKIPHNLALSFKQEGERRGNKVPYKHLIIIQRRRLIRLVIGGDSSHRATAVAHHRVAQQPPRLLLTLRHLPPLAGNRTRLIQFHQVIDIYIYTII